MNFAVIVFVLCVFTGVLWLADRFVFSKQRAADVERQQLQAAEEARKQIDEATK